MDIEIYQMKGIPNDEVPDVIADLQADPRYINHMVVPEGGGTSTIIAVFRKLTSALDAAVKVETIEKKPRKKRKKKSS